MGSFLTTAAVTKSDRIHGSRVVCMCTAVPTPRLGFIRFDRCYVAGLWWCGLLFFALLFLRSSFPPLFFSSVSFCSCATRSETYPESTNIEAGVAACDIQARYDVSQRTVSGILKHLRGVGRLQRSERSGKTMRNAVYRNNTALTSSRKL